MKNIFPKSAAVLSSTLTSKQKLRFDNPPHHLSFKYSPDILKRIILFTIPNHQISFLIIRYNSQSSDTVQKMVEEPMPRDPKPTSRFQKNKTSRFALEISYFYKNAICSRWEEHRGRVRQRTGKYRSYCNLQLQPIPYIRYKLSFVTGLAQKRGLHDRTRQDPAPG